MRLITLIYFSLFFISLSISQNVSLKFNLPGNYYVGCNGIYHDLLNAKENKYYKAQKLNTCDTLEIEYGENTWTIKFRLNDIQFKENDTLSLNFIQYNIIDTINFQSSCIDGTEEKSNVTFKERNKGKISINDLPDKLTIKIGEKELVLSKSVESAMTIETGNGMKSRKKWGYTKTTLSDFVFYSN